MATLRGVVFRFALMGIRWSVGLEPSSKLRMREPARVCQGPRCTAQVRRQRPSRRKGAGEGPRAKRAPAAICESSQSPWTSLSDSQYVAALANRDVPPQMVDTSSVRIRSGYLTAAQLKHIVKESRVSAILFATGRFNRLSEFRSFVEERFLPAAHFGKDGVLYVLGPRAQ